MRQWGFGTAAWLLLTAGCGNSALDSATRDACETVKNGSSLAIVASETAAAAPEVKADSNRYEVTLTNEPRRRAGILRFFPPEEGRVLFLVGGEKVTITMTDREGADIPADDVDDIDASDCGDTAQQKFVFPLSPGERLLHFTQPVNGTPTLGVTLVVRWLGPDN